MSWSFDSAIDEAVAFAHAVQRSKQLGVIMSFKLDIPHDRIQQNEVWKTTYGTRLHNETRHKMRTTDSLFGTSAGELDKESLGRLSFREP